MYDIFHTKFALSSRGQRARFLYLARTCVAPDWDQFLAYLRSLEEVLGSISLLTGEQFRTPANLGFLSHNHKPFGKE